MRHKYYAEEGCIRFEIEIHGLNPELDEDTFGEISRAFSSRENGYLVNGLDSRENYYMKRVYLACVRSIDLLTSLPEWLSLIHICAGKTTLGKAFAREMSLNFIDLDWFIEERFHKTVQQLFLERGEDGFRELERKMLHEVAEFEDVVVSTGGGTPCFFDNMEYMNDCGDTVFLDVEPAVLFRRLRVAKQQRPLLANKSDEELMDFICEALQKRHPFYSKAKHLFKADELEDKRQIQASVDSLRKKLNK